MKKYIPIIIFISLFLILGYLVFKNKNTSVKTETLSENNTQVNVQENKYNLPVKRDSPNVGSVLIHYFFTGTLKELQKTIGGTRIVFADADPSLPDIIVTDKTRVQKITPPYESNAISININTLKSGQYIDVSAEFDVRTGTWNILDVYLATDRN